VVIALASARDCASIRLKVPIRNPGLFYIGSGGALIYDEGRHTVKWACHLPIELAAECVSFLKKFNHPVFLNAMDDYWVDQYNSRVRMIEERYNLQTQPFSDPSQISHPIMRVSLAAPVPVLEEATEQAKSLFGERLQVSLASPDWLDLLPPNAGKGNLLATLQEMSVISPEETIAIGDYESDLSLFEHARHRVAMGNATPAVKAAASYITETNNEDGVAQALQVFF
jgi:Cof subfamily protein (haloacid dehalogenase superfamily)